MNESTRLNIDACVVFRNNAVKSQNVYEKLKAHHSFHVVVLIACIIV